MRYGHVVFLGVLGAMMVGCGAHGGVNSPSTAASQAGASPAAVDRRSREQGAVTF